MVVAKQKLKFSIANYLKYSVVLDYHRNSDDRLCCPTNKTPVVEEGSVIYTMNCTSQNGHFARTDYYVDRK